MLFRFCPCVAKAMRFLLNISSDVDATPISVCLADSMHELTHATNISQADDIKPFNEYYSDEFKLFM